MTISGRITLKIQAALVAANTYDPQMDIEVFLEAFDQALDSQAGYECDRADRLALVVWWLVDRLADELALEPSEASAQVQMMAAVAAEQMSEIGTKPH